MTKRTFFVLTGGPGVGKSSLIRLLAKKGYKVLPESYRWMRLLLSVESLYTPNRPYEPLFPQSLFDLHLAFERFRENTEFESSGPVFLV